MYSARLALYDLMSVTQMSVNANSPMRNRPSDGSIVNRTGVWRVTYCRDQLSLKTKVSVFYSSMVPSASRCEETWSVGTVALDRVACTDGPY